MKSIVIDIHAHFTPKLLFERFDSNVEQFSGVVLTRERYFSTDSTTSGFEGLLGGAFRAFRYDHPKLDVSLTSQAYPSFVTEGRVRLQSDLRVSYELWKDFMLTGTLFDTYDSKPPAEDIPKNDYGTTLAISWTF